MTPYRTAVVTGASGGIGRAVVDELVRLGLHVHALGLPDASHEAMRGLGAVTIHPADVRDTAALGRTLTAVLGMGDVDVLVNNAGIVADLQPAQASSVRVP